MSIHTLRNCGYGLIALTSFALLLTSVDASASSREVASVYVLRPLVLPEGVLRIDAGHHWPFYDAWFKHTVIRGAPDQQYLNPGVTLGLAEGFEFGVVAPVRLSPGVQVEDPRIHALFQFHRGELEAGIFSSLRFGFRDRTEFVGGVPLSWHIQPRLRLDTGGFLKLGLIQESSVALIAPAQLVFQPTPQVFAGPETGFIAYNLFDDGSGVAIPLGGFVGYTLTTGGGTLGDLYARLRIEDLAHGFAAVSLMFGAEFFFEL